MLEENSKITALLEKMFDRMSAVYALDLPGQRYEKVKTDDFMFRVLGDQGSLKDAYAKLFLAIREGERVSNAYEAFRDQAIFERENHAGNIRLISADEEQSYDYRILKLDDASAVIVFFHCEEGYESDRMEKLKMDAIQENYLFSMIGDLKNDTLRNSVTTELSVDKQDYLELKYSKWRYVISNMFLPDDRALFLRISDPKYVIEHLEKEKSFRFEMQMQNMQGQHIWVRLLEQMGSRLQVESVYGEGAVFSFTLTLPVVDATPVGVIEKLHDQRMQEELAARKNYAKGAKILAVDDNQVNLAVLEGLLKDFKVEVDCARSGKRALKMIQAKDYDLILLDHLMPEMDGIETLAHIRDMGGSYMNLPVVALTANVSGDSKRRYKQAGFSDFLEKPISIQELERVLDAFLPGE